MKTFFNSTEKTNKNNEAVYVFENDDYRITLTQTDDDWQTKRKYFRYAFVDKTWAKRPIFQDTEFSPSPLYRGVNERTISELFGFLVVSQYDVDDEYFKKYTKRQFEYLSSKEFRNFQMFATELEETLAEEH